MRETTHAENTSPYEPPNSQRVLELLKEAGEAGVLAPEIARCFTTADPRITPTSQIQNVKQANLQRRLSWVNQILVRFRKRGWVVRGDQEKSPFYHNVPTFRWYITDTGVAYLAAGMAAGVRSARMEAARRHQAELAEWHKHLDDLITQGYIDFDDPKSMPMCERNAAIRALRDAGCTLHDIGGVFDITRERVRQVLIGQKVSPCTCPRCQQERWFD